MPLDANSPFTLVEMGCSCADGSLSGAIVRDTFEFSSTFSYILPTVDGGVLGGAWDENDPDVAEVIRRVKAGTCAVYFAEGTRTWLDEDTPDGYSRIRSHPFHKTDGYKYGTVLIDHSHIVQDANTGRKDIQHEFGMLSTSRTPDGPTFNYPLEELIVLQDSNAVRFTVRFEPTEDYEHAEIENDPTIMAFKSWLRANIIEGTAPPVDGALIYDAGDIYPYEFNERRYQFIQNPDDAVHVRARIVAVNALFSAGIYQAVEVVFGRTTTVAHDINQLNDLFDNATGSIPTRDGIERPPFGTHGGGAITAGSLKFKTVKLTEVQGRVVVVGKDHLGSRYAIPIEGQYGRMIDWSNLETIGTDATKKYAPRHHDTVVYNVNALRSVRFRHALQMVESNDTYRFVRFVNKQGQLDIEGRDGQRLFRLEDGEIAEFLIMLQESGAGSIVNAASLPLRKQIISSGLLRDSDGAIAGQLSTAPYLVKDASNYFRYIPMPSFVDSNHEDAFRIGSAHIANGQDLRTYEGPYDTSYAVQLLQGGKLTCDLDFEIATFGSFAGELDAYVQLFASVSEINNGVPVPFGRNEFNDLAGVGSRRRYSIREQRNVNAGDIVFAGLVYNVGSTALLSLMRVELFERRLELETSVEVNG